MKMDPADIKKYRALHEYVSVRIPEVRKMPFIIDVLKKFSGNTSEEDIKEALLWNKGPSIQIVPGLICAGVAASGCYAPSSNKIRVKEERVKEFEKGKDLKHTATGRLVYYIGVTLLHEFCHWANDGSGGAADLTHAKFEQALYGKVINASDK
jgi:hypothetical protein